MTGDTVILQKYAVAIYPPATKGQWRALVIPRKDMPPVSFFGAGRTRDQVIVKAWRAIDAALKEAQANTGPGYAKAA